MRIVVVGSGGRLGGALTRYFGAEHEVVAFDRKALDLAQPEVIDDRLLPIDFDVLVNTAALTSVDECESQKEAAQQVNVDGPGRIAALCAERGVRMVHVSTDYVYDGSTPGLRTEEARTNPLGVYGRTKLAGEKAVLGASHRHLVLRTAWVFGPDRPSFVDSILKRAVTSHQVNAISDKFASPTYTADFGPNLERLLEVGAGGIYNVCNSGECSWHAFGSHALQVVRRLGVETMATELGEQKLDEMTSFLAPRPVFTGMSTRKLTEASGVKPRAWEEAVEEYLATFYATS